VEYSGERRAPTQCAGQTRAAQRDGKTPAQVVVLRSPEGKTRH
jgi:hypothetical protein